MVRGLAPALVPGAVLVDWGDGVYRLGPPGRIEYIKKETER